jgi:hypothetical protein
MTDVSVVVSSASATALSDGIAVGTDNSEWFVDAGAGTYDILTDRGSVVNFEMVLKDTNDVARNLENCVITLKVFRRRRDTTPALTLTSAGSEIEVLNDGLIRFTIGSALTNALDKGDNVYDIILSEFNTEETIVTGQFNVDRRSATLQFDSSVTVASAEATATGGDVLATVA